MKKGYLITIAVLLVAIVTLLAYLFLFPDSSVKDNSTVDDPSQINENGQEDSSLENDENDHSESGENDASPSEATLQEDEGNLVIIIPDDQESAGE